MFQSFTPEQYLMIDIANNFGLDHLDWQDRINFAIGAKANLFDPQKLPEYLKAADKPQLLYAGVQAWKQACEGKPIGYSISLDATSSGLQILAALTCDRIAASMCNVIDAGARMDAYTNVFEKVKEAAKASVTLKDTSAVDLPRKDVKKAVMTAFYSSTKTPESVFGKGELLQIFYSMLQQYLPRAWELNLLMPTLWDPTVIEHNWVMPDNFHVHIPVMATQITTTKFMGNYHEVRTKVNAPIKQGLSLGANMVHSVDGYIAREVVRRCMFNRSKVDHIRELCVQQSYISNSQQPVMYDKNGLMLTQLWFMYKTTGILSTRVFDYINKDTVGLIDPKKVIALIDTLPAEPFEVLVVHDCFRCLPHYGDDLRRQYNHQLAAIADSKLLEHLLMGITQNKKTGKDLAKKIRAKDKSLSADILEANYALT